MTAGRSRGQTRMWINGEEGTTGYLPDEGLFFGRGVFETLRVGTTPWFLDAHLARLRHGAERLGLANPFTETELLRLVEHESLCDCAMRLTLTPENRIVQIRPLPYTEADQREGLRLVVGQTRRNARSVLAGMKTLCYADSLLEREAAAARGCREALLLNTEEKLAEGSASNLFLVRRGRVFTPDVSCGLLPGIVRQWVLQALDGKAGEGRYTLENLREADEVFLTNSLMGVMGVRELVDVGAWPIGPVTRELQGRYERADKA